MSNTHQTEIYYDELTELRDQLQARIDSLVYGDDDCDGKGRTIAEYFYCVNDTCYDVYCSECKTVTLTVNELLEIPFEPYVCYACDQPDDVKESIAFKKKWSSTVEIVHKIRDGIANDGVDPQVLVEKIRDLQK
jgi:hypothetical protein